MNYLPASFAALPLMLTACHSAPQPDAAATATAAVSDFQNKIVGLSEASREGVFQRAIDDAGLDCQKVTSATQRAPIGGLPAWTLLCERNTPYVAIVNPGDYLQIVPGTPITSASQ